MWILTAGLAELSLSNVHEKLLFKAFNMARGHYVKGLPSLAAIIADKTRVISTGVNSFKTHPLQARFCEHPEAIHLHAEIAALAAAKSEVAGCTMYVGRSLRDGTPALARPCKACTRAIAAFNISRIYWTE